MSNIDELDNSIFEDGREYERTIQNIQATNDICYDHNNKSNYFFVCNVAESSLKYVVIPNMKNSYEIIKKIQENYGKQKASEGTALMLKLRENVKKLKQRIKSLEAETLTQ